MADGSEPTILALSPSAEALAYAVTEDTRLLDYGVRPFEVDEEERLVSEQAVAAAEAALDHFAPDVMAMPRFMPDGSYERSQRNLLSDRIRAVAVRKELKTYQVARGAVRKAVAGNPESSREGIVEALLNGYPELRTFARNGTPEFQEDVAEVFEAVRLAVTAERAQETAKQQARWFRT